MESPETRTCTRCGIEKPIEEFGFKYRERGIRQSWCKPCYVEYKRVWYLENREKHIAHVRMLRDQHSAENQPVCGSTWRLIHVSTAGSAIRSFCTSIIFETSARTSPT